MKTEDETPHLLKVKCEMYKWVLSDKVDILAHTVRIVSNPRVYFSS